MTDKSWVGCVKDAVAVVTMISLGAMAVSLCVACVVSVWRWL